MSDYVCHHSMKEPGCAFCEIHSLGARLRAAEERAEKAESLVYVPGLWKCAKCNFTLVQSNLNAFDGTVTARDTPGDKCPNCNMPLWRVTWKQDRNEVYELCEQQIDRARLAEAQAAGMRGVLEREALNYDKRAEEAGAEAKSAEDRAQKHYWTVAAKSHKESAVALRQALSALPKMDKETA